MKGVSGRKVGGQTLIHHESQTLRLNGQLGESTGLGTWRTGVTTGPVWDSGHVPSLLRASVPFLYEGRDLVQNSPLSLRIPYPCRPIYHRLAIIYKDSLFPT